MGVEVRVEVVMDTGEEETRLGVEVEVVMSGCFVYHLRQERLDLLLGNMCSSWSSLPCSTPDFRTFRNINPWLMLVREIRKGWIEV
jgi:hypothetical protein